ncbi:MAG: hypothetical protein ACJAZO_005092 [Myxococcota bacterium]|jgi:hypothetical protein
MVHLFRSSRERLSNRDLHRFTGDSLMDSVATVICGAECLARKEFFESYEVAKRILRRHRGGPVVDLAGGHGLVGFFVALMDRGTGSIVVVDKRIPKSAARLREALSVKWPFITEKWNFEEGKVEDAVITSADRVLGIHACGRLTDAVLGLADKHRARVAVLPCCHSHATLDSGGLEGWMPMDVAIDATRAAMLKAANYQVFTTTISEDITPMNRMLLGTPVEWKRPTS